MNDCRVIPIRQLRVPNAVCNAPYMVKLVHYSVGRLNERESNLRHRLEDVTQMLLADGDARARRVDTA